MSEAMLTQARRNTRAQQVAQWLTEGTIEVRNGAEGVLVTTHIPAAAITVVESNVLITFAAPSDVLVTDVAQSLVTLDAQGVEIFRLTVPSDGVVFSNINLETGGRLTYVSFAYIE